jgi:hypothetical protein
MRRLVDIRRRRRESLVRAAVAGGGRYGMRRLSSIFIAVCMVLIAGSIGGVLFLAFKFYGRTAAIVALAALVCMAMSTP